MYVKKSHQDTWTQHSTGHFLYTLMPNGIILPYQFDETMSNLRDNLVVIYIFIQNLLVISLSEQDKLWSNAPSYW